MTRRTVKDFGPDPIDQYVGSRIRARRVGLEMSQTKLGQTIDVTFQQIQKYENGTNRVSASNLYKIAKALGVEVSFFYDGMPESLASDIAGPNNNSADPPNGSFDFDPLTSREAIELVHHYFLVRSDTVRKRLFQFIKAMATAGQH